MKFCTLGAFDLDCIALFLDVDGALLEFAPSPQSVVAPEGLNSSLAGAESALGGALALVSGRTVSDLDRLFQPLQLRATGVHGAEFRFDPAAPDAVAGGVVALPDRLWRRLTAILAAFPGSVAENKRYSFAVHCCNAPRLAARLREALLRLACDESALDLELIEGRLAFELKTRGIDKGVGIRSFMARAPFAGRTPIFVGDDVTDESGFAAAVTLRGLAFSVGRSRPSVIEAFPDPAAVRGWLDDLAAQRARA